MGLLGTVLSLIAGGGGQQPPQQVIQQQPPQVNYGPYILGAVGILAVSGVLIVVATRD